MTEATDQTESKTQFAARLGVSKARVSQLSKQGLPLNKGRVPVKRALDWLRANGKLAETLDRQPAPGRANAPATESEIVGQDEALDSLAARLASGDMLSTAEAHRVKENYLARLRMLQFHRESERVVDIEAVADVVTKQFSTVRAKLLALPHSAAPLAAHQDVNAVVKVLNDKVHECLEELSAAGQPEGGEEVAREALKHGR